MTDKKKAATTLATSGVAEDENHGAVAPPLVLSTTFTWANHEDKPPYDYARRATPNRDQLLHCLCDLEGAAGGVVTASGLAALGVALNLVGPGDTVLAPFDCYGGTHRMLTALAKRAVFQVEFADLSDPAQRKAAFARRPKLAYLETPSNPLMRITDLAACAEEARAAGCLTIADNTFLTPLLQSPIALGCDMVVHSTTKFIAGHSDVVGGAILAADEALGEELAWWANCTGVTGPAFDSWLTLRGVRTLAVRLNAQQATARQLVERLAADARVASVYDTALPSHPQHALASQQQKGPGSVFSFELETSIDLHAFLSALKIINLAESLGGFESLICVPDSMTHAGMDEAARQAAGISPRLLRVSVGIEDAEDLWRDLETALDAASAATARE